MKNILILLFCFITLSGLGQNKADSLISVLPSIEDYRVKTQILYKIYWGFVYSNPDSALAYCRQALKLGEENRNDSIIAKSYNLTGIVYDVVSIPDTALMYYDSAMKYAKLARDTGLIAGVHNNSGLIHWNNGAYDEAIGEYLKSETIYLKIGKKKGLANCYGNIGLIYFELDDYDKALNYQNKALKLHQELNNIAGEQSVKLNIAIEILSPYNDKSLPEDDSLAFQYLRENESYFLSKSNYYTIGKVYSIQATFYSDNEQHDSAYVYGEKALDAYRKIGSKNLLASSLFNSSFYIVHYNNDRARANKRVEEAYEIIKETGSLDFRYKLTNHLGNIYSGNEKFEKATEMYRESIDLRDSMYSRDRNQLIYETEAKYESEKKEKEIIQQKAELLESDLKSLKKQRMINLLIGSLAVLGLLSFFYFLRRRKLAQIEKEKAIQTEREKGLRAVIGSQEQERERIAKNLHDGVIQQLVSLKFGMDNLLDEHKTKLVKQLDDATYELRDLSHDLMPKNLEKFGLNEAISNLLETSLVNTNINYTYDCYGLKNNISKDIEINLYRTVQELIHNAVKHSNANQIDAQLYQIENSLHLIFEDNGKGFDIEEKAQGIGLQSINSRIKTINGTVNYESKPNEGTITTIKIQIN